MTNKFIFMKAIALKSFGGAENLLQKEIPLPVVSESEVLIKTRAFSINPVDIKTRNGKGVASQLKETEPMILGWDFSGQIVESGKNVTSLKKGDEVFGLVNFPGPGKTYAEYITAMESQLTRKPANISHAEAAGLHWLPLLPGRYLKIR